jgi:ribosome biogenesis SPOUT family RNA methylase Rps3
MYIIEHLEPRIWKWCLIEYKHILKIVGRKNLWFTNVKKGSSELKKYGRVIKSSVKYLNLKNACVLDPDAKKTLTPKEAQKFHYFIFGGILGDWPPKKRTKQLLSSFLNCEKRNIGKKQMSTDTAVFVVKSVKEGTPLHRINFRRGIEISTGKNESVRMPYQYALIDGKQLISPELVSYLKRKRGF